MSKAGRKSRKNAAKPATRNQRRRQDYKSKTGHLKPKDPNFQFNYGTNGGRYDRYYGL